MRDKDDPTIDCSILPFNDLDYWGTSPIDPVTQRDAFDEILEQLWTYLRAAYRNREDRWQALRIVIQAEKLVAEYRRAGFSLLLPLAELIHDLFRMERRVFIRRVLLCREEHRALYQEALKRWNCDADAADDFRAVEAALEQGRALFDDLR